MTKIMVVTAKTIDKPMVIRSRYFSMRVVPAKVDKLPEMEGESPLPFPE